MKFVKPCYFVGSSKKAIYAMPKDVNAAFGVALYLAQTRAEAANVKALTGAALWR